MYVLLKRGARTVAFYAGVLRPLPACENVAAMRQEQANT